MVPQEQLDQQDPLDMVQRAQLAQRVLWDESAC